MSVDLTDPRSLSNDTLKDLLKTTTENHPWDGQFETLQKYHDYPVCNAWFKKDKVELDGGVSVVRNVQYRENGSAKFVSPGDTSSPTIIDTQARLMVNWVQAQADYSIIRQEMMRNRGKAKLIKLVDTRRSAALGDLANLLEDYAWKAPTGPTDLVNPLGIPYWLVPITGAQVTAATAGFQGTYPSGFSSCAGIACSTTDYTRWRSYNDVWSNSSGDITDTDISKIVTMLRKLRFKGPWLAEDAMKAPYDQMRIYTCETVLNNLEERARANNDQLGNDVAKYGNGGTVINNIPIQWVEQLDAAASPTATYGLYAINHAYFYPVVMSGDYFRETGPMNDRTQHDVFTTFVDLQFQFLCINRQRAGGCISYVAAG